MLYVTLTTIQTPTQGVRQIAQSLANGTGHLVIAGDAKGPHQFDLGEVSGFYSRQLTFLSIESQFQSGFRLAECLPRNHYCRKNIAYLYAIREGATCLYETDDDNAPLESWGQRLEYICPSVVLKEKSAQSPAWVNAYSHFSDENIWPRGLPLDRIHTELASSTNIDGVTATNGTVWAPIQQGLANGSPDVDAVWRLVLNQEFTFKSVGSALLPPGQWCPFNTQSTWWWPAVYPLLYVPSNCSFRMCDIWKSFVAQRCLWELGTGVVFHAPEVYQERNVHNLMRDFVDEIPGYQLNDRIARHLEATSLKTGVDNVSSNLRACYEKLISEGIFPGIELTLVDAWLEDLCSIEDARRPELATA